jgi:hypothetical protein
MVLWLWPWHDRTFGKFISVGLSGTGQFGDASFTSLAAIDEAWEGFYSALIEGPKL